MKGLTSAASTSSTTVAVGDLVIFDNTYDRNKNDRLDDRDTHAAIVVGFEGSDTAVIYHRVRSGHKIGRLNLRDSHRVFSREGRHRLNDVLRRVAKRSQENPATYRAAISIYVRVFPQRQCLCLMFQNSVQVNLQEVLLQGRLPNVQMQVQRLLLG